MKDTDRDITVEIADIHSAEALDLIRAMSQEMAELYNEEGFSSLVPARMDDPRSAFVIVRFRGQPAGCGALRPLEGNIGEVKRMYVVPALRGRGIARRILEAIETCARQLGYIALQLETGTLQPQAVRLYERVGYHRIECYDEYAGSPLSICFAKELW
ncbi:MAG: GNAT family N-acetyltransferase [Anaerolineae bacterium]